MADIVTLAERRARKMDAIGRSLAALDAALIAYARQAGGRFIRFGSTATGRAAPHSDVDIIADFPGTDDIAASLHAEALCLGLGLTPDPRPIRYVSERLLQRARSEGIVLG
jgi:hypothetical protein